MSGAPAAGEGSGLIQIRRRSDSTQEGWSLSIFLDAGFRPFFLLAGFYACAPLAAWLMIYAGGPSFLSGWPAATWHGHEMLYGFVAAAMAGFLLTAVPKWTRTEPASRGRLAILVGAWTAGRVAMWAQAWLPAPLVAAVDLAFFPLLALTVGPAILRTRNRRNYAFPLVLALFLVGNALTHFDPSGRLGPLGLQITLALTALVVVIIGGRIVPAFTYGALERAGVEVKRRPLRALRVVSLVLVVAGLAADFALSLRAIAGGLEIAAGLSLLAFLPAWYGHRTLRVPILWILQLAWLWLGAAFLIRGLALTFGFFPATLGLHAFTAGAIGTMILAVMTRAALGHTGRPLEVRWPIALAYGLVTLGAAVRVFAPMFVPERYAQAAIIGGTLWILGYLVYVAVYLPILGQPRVDGRPG